MNMEIGLIGENGKEISYPGYERQRLFGLTERGFKTAFPIYPGPGELKIIAWRLYVENGIATIGEMKVAPQVMAANDRFELSLFTDFISRI